MIKKGNKGDVLRVWVKRWQHSTMGSIPLDPAASSSIPSIPEIFSEEFFYVAEVNQWCWLEESGQSLENVDQNHLVVATGKSVLQKGVSLPLGPK